MTDVTNSQAQNPPASRGKFIIGGLLIVAAVIYLIASSTQAAAQYYLTIDELVEKAGSYGDRDIKVSGAVIGESITYDTESLTLRFTAVNVPADLGEIEDEGGLAEALHKAVLNPVASRIEVVYVGPKPDLLRHEAQAIVTGRVGDDGVFYADELLLKCPTRYEDEVPLQVDEG